MKKAILIIIGVLVFGYIAFICEESIRLKNNDVAKPLIIIDQIMCDRESIACYGDDKEYTESYTSLGFNVKRTFRLDERSSEDNLMYYPTSGEFWLFDKLL